MTHGFGPPAMPCVPASRSVTRTEPDSRRCSLQRPVVRSGRVPLGGQDQRRRQLAGPGPHVEGLLPRRRPVRARQVRPHVVPGLERRHAREPGVVPVPHLPLGRPGRVVALDGRVDRVRVLRLDRRLLMRPGLLDQRLRVALEIRRQRLRAVRPVVVVVPGRQERPLQLPRPDLSARRLRRPAAPPPSRSCAAPSRPCRRARTRRRAWRSTPGSPPSGSSNAADWSRLLRYQTCSGSGFTAESNTIRRTCEGNSVAYSAPK